jgi:hypothetical protein
LFFDASTLFNFATSFKSRIISCRVDDKFDILAPIHCSMSLYLAADSLQEMPPPPPHNEIDLDNFEVHLGDPSGPGPARSRSVSRFFSQTQLIQGGSMAGWFALRRERENEE